MLSTIHLNSYMIDPKTNNRYIHKYFTEKIWELSRVLYPNILRLIRWTETMHSKFIYLGHSQVIVSY